MTFAAPARLGLLVVVATLLACYVVLQRRRPRYALRFTNLDLLDVVAPHRPGVRRHLPAVVLLAAVATMVVGLARPARSVQVARRTGAVVVAIDVSPSMMATDVVPSRLVAAQTAVGRFSELLPTRIRLGLVSFAGTAHVVVPPTSDHELVRQALGQLRFRSETAVGEAIHASVDVLAIHGDEAAGIVVLSDGASTTGRSQDDAARRAREAGVPVSTIAFGTASGTVILGGERVAVPPEPSALERIASITSGRFFEAASTAELLEVYQTIGASVTTVEERQDLTVPFLGVALALTLLASALSLAWFSRLP